MRLQNKAFPHPVLRPDLNDFLDSSFQVSHEIGAITEGQVIELSVNFLLANDPIEILIKDGYAAFFLDVYCSDTVYREAHQCKAEDVIRFDAGALHGKVEIFGSIVALKSVDRFHSDDFNSEFGDQSYRLIPGDIIAFDEGSELFVEFDHLAFESLIRVETLAELHSETYSVETGGQMITIYMGENLRSLYDELLQDSVHRMHFAMSIYKDCVMSALVDLIEDQDGEVSGYRWARSLEKKIQELGLALPDHGDFNSINMLAQNLVADMGIRRLIRYGN